MRPTLMRLSLVRQRKFLLQQSNYTCAGTRLHAQPMRPSLKRPTLMCPSLVRQRKFLLQKSEYT
jgi:hypothetical protein